MISSSRCAAWVRTATGEVAASLQNYVLVSQDEAKVEVFRRPERGRWDHGVARAGETLVIGGRTIRVDDVYRRAG